MAKKKITEAVEEPVVEESAEDKAAAKVAAAAVKAEAAAEKKAAKKAESEAKKAAKEASKQNGELPPREGSKCALVWDTATALSEAQGSPIDGKSLAASEPMGEKGPFGVMNSHTIKTQYARWRKFHGITGRISVPKAEEAEEAAE